MLCICAVLNIIGNSVATVVMARWEDAYDTELAEHVLSGREVQEAAMIETSH